MTSSASFCAFSLGMVTDIERLSPWVNSSCNSLPIGWARRNSLGATSFAPGLFGDIQNSEGGSGRHRPLRVTYDLAVFLRCARRIASHRAQNPAQLSGSGRGLVRLSIQEPLALCRGEQCGCPFPIGQIARVGAEIEFGEIARQVRFADVVEGAVDPALQQREMAFGRIDVRVPAELYVFVGVVVDAPMPG